MNVRELSVRLLCSFTKKYKKKKKNLYKLQTTNSHSL